MLLLNFTHPLTNAQCEQITALAGQPIKRTLGAMIHFDPAQPLAAQITAYIDGCASSGGEPSGPCTNRFQRAEGDGEARAKHDGASRAAAHQVGIGADEWQTQPILVNLPGHAAAAACVLAELHGRMGHFPAIVRLRPVEGAPVTTFAVAEIINLQALRERARTRR